MFLLKNYLLNFWIWWYWIESRVIASKLLRLWNFVLEFTNVLPMAANLLLPFYQDYSLVGRIIAFPIRLGWVLLGSILLLILAVPLLLIYLCYLVLPLIPLYMTFKYFRLF